MCKVDNIAFCTSNQRPESIIAGGNLGVRRERER
jgi:hypothetical protein